MNILKKGWITRHDYNTHVLVELRTFVSLHNNNNYWLVVTSLIVELSFSERDKNNIDNVDLQYMCNAINIF